MEKIKNPIHPIFQIKKEVEMACKTKKKTAKKKATKKKAAKKKKKR